MLFCSEKPPELRFYNAGDLVSRDGFLHQRRTMECWVMIYVLSGALNIAVSGNELTVGKGEWLLLQPGAEHSGTSPSAGELSYLWGHFSSSEPLIPSESAPDGAALVLPEHGKAASQRVSLLFRQLVDISRRNTYTPRMAEYALGSLLMEISQEYLDSLGSDPGLSPLIADINEWIRLNCHRRLDILAIASEFHYNPEYLSALYRRLTGVTLTAAVNRARTEIARKLLSDRNISIKEAAYSCGFSDEKYFMRVFRQTEGMTPSEYREALGVK